MYVFLCCWYGDCEFVYNVFLHALVHERTCTFLATAAIIRAIVIFTAIWRLCFCDDPVD